MFNLYCLSTISTFQKCEPWLDLNSRWRLPYRGSYSTDWAVPVTSVVKANQKGIIVIYKKYLMLCSHVKNWQKIFLYIPTAKKRLPNEFWYDKNAKHPYFRYLSTFPKIRCFSKVILLYRVSNIKWVILKLYYY